MHPIQSGAWTVTYKIFWLHPCERHAVALPVIAAGGIASRASVEGPRPCRPPLQAHVPAAARHRRLVDRSHRPREPRRSLRRRPGPSRRRHSPRPTGTVRQGPPRRRQDRQLPPMTDYSYILSRKAAYWVSTYLRLSLRLGVISPDSTVRSRSRMVNFLMVSQRFRPALSSSM